ncbi:MAG: hypothetical protein JO112_17730 [Planctomycetes bacterium]|nr:hypothetical protein [Planctomycetota bacterium]
MFARFPRCAGRPALRLGVLLLAGLVGGCGGGTGNVSGKVTFQGRPLPAGTILFYHGINGVASSDIKPDGTYRVSNVSVGTAKIEIQVPMNIPFAGANLPGASAAPTLPVARAPAIPARYLDREKSGLSCTVTRGNQTHDIDLKP